MTTSAHKLMSLEEFFDWQARQQTRYELVEGVPVEMMAGASSAHDFIVTNLIIDLGNQLRGSGCRPATADLGIRTKIRSLRRADVLVTCDTAEPNVYEAINPRMVVEVLSPRNTGVHWERKLKEYRRHPKLEFILLVDSRVVAASLFIRNERGWDDAAIDGDQASDAFDLQSLGCRLTLAEMYRDTGLLK